MIEAPAGREDRSTLINDAMTLARRKPVCTVKVLDKPTDMAVLTTLNVSIQFTWEKMGTPARMF